MDLVGVPTEIIWYDNIRKLIELDGKKLEEFGLTMKDKIRILNSFWKERERETEISVRHHTIENIEEPSGILDIEDETKKESEDLEDIMQPIPIGYDESLDDKFKLIIIELIERESTLITVKDYDKFKREMSRKYTTPIPTAWIIYMYRKMLSNDEIVRNEYIETKIKGKPTRGQHGVTVVTVLTTGYPVSGEEVSMFSCKWNCKYCPTEPGQPKSYLKNEPAVLRANRNGFDPIFQVWDRLNAYISNNHIPDKIELLVLGGTWDSYPKEYRDEFIRDLYYACNTMFDKFKYSHPRKRYSLQEEKLINETTFSKIIGLTLETRPDMISKTSLREFIEYGVTRIQLGVQHFNDDILKLVDRRCPTRKTIHGIKMLKDACFKVDIHVMPDLPGSNPELDKIDIVDRVNKDPACQADQIKYYPCETVDHTEILEWYESGKYKPYGDRITGDGTNPLEKLLIYAKSTTPPWIRLNRVIRDIPNTYIKGGNNITNLRQCLQNEMKKLGLKCKCIRCREIMGKKIDPSEAIIIIRNYEASEGTEYFISYETPDEEVIFGFLRLRITETPGSNTFNQLKDCALIRELHIYGEVVAVGDRKTGKAQHYGFGKKLLEKAEEIVLTTRYRKVAVISGNGVKPYYRKLGYIDDELRGYLIKNISSE